MDDIVVEFDGRALEKPERLQWLASMAGVGHVAKLQLIRDTRVSEVNAVLTELLDKPIGREPRLELRRRKQWLLTVGRFAARPT